MVKCISPYLNVVESGQFQNMLFTCDQVDQNLNSRYKQELRFESSLQKNSAQSASEEKVPCFRMLWFCGGRSGQYICKENNLNHLIISTAVFLMLGKWHPLFPGTVH